MNHEAPPNEPSEDPPSTAETLARLRSRIEDLEAILRVLPVGVGISTDAHCGKIMINPALAEMLGLDNQQNASLSAPPGEAPTVFEVWAQGHKLAPHELPMQTAARENREVRNFDEVIVRKDGRRLHVTSDSVPLRAPDGSVRGVAAVFRDVTDVHQATEERIAIERRLLESQQSENLGLLAAGIAHDFNNMLSIIMGSSELASMDLDADSPIQEYLSTIESTVRRAGDLCQQLLAYSGQGRFVVQRLDVNAAVNETLALLKPTILQRHAVELHLLPDLPSIVADSAQFQQVLLHLLNNAAEACGEQRGHISITTDRIDVDQQLAASMVPEQSLRPGLCIRLRVTDNGSGMTPETLAKVFSPFFTTKFTGRGLGLAAVLGIARGHRGAVQIQSQPGQGTAVDVYFPETDETLQSQPTAPPAGTPASQPLPGTLDGRVLVVDDEQILRRSVTLQLTRLGLDVDTAADGVEALEAMEAHHGQYDLVILDVTMPRLGGFDTLEQIRKKWPRTQALVMSGFAPQKIAEEFARLKPEAIVSKPFIFTHLRREVTRVLTARN